MSSNIRGITFAEQSVTPADDAIVRRAMLSDGILSGCNITYSGSTLTLAAGYMIACGRIFQITAAQNWAVVDATSGVARLVLTIDLTKTATETAFDQISFGIEYASSEDGFVSLTQDDINIAGVRYQASVAVVSLGTGGITGILSKLEKAEGGGGLNFNVVGGLTQPTGPKENMIWVRTPVKITGWYISPDQPQEMSEGDVWILSASSGQIQFNALKKNALVIYLVAAHQYINGVLTPVTAQIYQNGAWVDWLTYLYDSGKQYETITGGWRKYDGIRETVEIGTDKIQFIRDASGVSGVHATVSTENKINLAGYNTLTAYAAFDATSSGSVTIGATDAPTAQPTYVASRVIKGESVSGAFSADLSHVTGEHYVAITFHAIPGIVTKVVLQ